MRRLQQAVHNFLICVSRLVSNKRVRFSKRGSLTGQIQRDAAQQRRAVSLRRRLHTFLLQPVQNEIVDGIAYPGRIGDLGGIGPLGRLERPMFLPRRSLLDPLLQQRDLPLGKLAPGGDGRYPALLVGGGDALDHGAFFQVARENRAVAVAEILLGRLFHVEVEHGGAMGLVRAMAREAVLRQDRPDVAIELDLLRQGRAGRSRHLCSRAHRK